MTRQPVNPLRPAREPRVITQVEAARLLSRSVRTIRQYRRQGLLRTIVINGRAGVEMASVNALIERGRH